MQTYRAGAEVSGVDAAKAMLSIARAGVPTRDFREGDPVLQFFVHDWSGQVAWIFGELFQQTTGHELTVTVVLSRHS
jgi:hypothetical protein